MAKKNQKKEALSVSRLITEVLVEQLGIPFRNIVNDTTFSSYTGSKRPDLLISNIEYVAEEEEGFVKNLLCYVEAKDPSCNIGDADWKDAFKQGKDKSKKLGIPFFGVTNCKTTYFYNGKTGERLKLNGNLISEFQTLDVFRIIKK
ncbi:MAG: type I restriction enzyme HsdR N-terminal domain-containing protein, partial [Bacteroidales bacterium]|nr:type I restriction enzyme HsdR N-terminal domain-containing protein [Bacteroidales bacterium]